MASSKRSQKNKVQFILLFGLLSLFISCLENEPKLHYVEHDVLINTELFEEDFLGSLTIIEAKAKNRILYLKVGYSGCGEADVFTLVFSEKVIDTAPPSLEAKLIFEPVTICAAYFTSEIQFDLNQIDQIISRTFRIILNGWEDTIEVR